MFLQGFVSDPSTAASADGATPVVNMGRANEALVAELHGKYFTQCYRGNVYASSTATTGVVIPIATTLTPTYSLWNPAGSGKLLVPIVCYIGWTSTTAALGTVLWMATTNAGSSISSTAPFVAFGTGTPVNQNLGAGKVSQVRAANGGTTTLVAAATVFRESGWSITATTAATSVAPGWTWRDDFDGSAIIPPGNAIHLMATTAIAITATITTIWYEPPL
jgi:hypothetical protein